MNSTKTFPQLAGALMMLAVVQTLAQAQSEQAISFNQDIRPILSDRCFACHGPDAESREADLRLDQSDGPDGAYASAIVPGSIEDSEVWSRIISDDPDYQMPPPNSQKPMLSSSERLKFKRWIESGAEYKKFWAFETPNMPAAPSVRNSEWSQHPIDLHVLAKLESQDVLPSEEADDRTLIRRLTFDLTGLPPSREEVHAFLQDREDSPDDAWEKHVDRLLASPRYGEHMARYWLDLVRFADTNGMHKDFYRNLVAYRDWVIRAFNDNLGYDDFLRFQLAGDLYEEPTQDQLIASGFHRLHLIIDRGTALPEESFTKNVIDRVTSVGTGFMGLTVHCAQCHDHKYDPITQKDFYSLYAFFNNIDAAPETVAHPKFGLQAPFISLAAPEENAKLDQSNKELAQWELKIKQIQASIENAKKTKAQEETDDANTSSTDDELTRLQAQIKKLESNRNKAKRKRDSLDRSIPRAMVMKERAEVRATFMLERGQYDAPGEQVQRDTPAFLPPLKKQGEVASRMDLAYWFTRSDHPLTARVQVNRVWQQFFGTGLVKTSEDLGAQGEVPSHPELLDQMSVSFVNSGWDIKSLVKQIVMSKTYRQSSRLTPAKIKLDPDNRLLARGSRFRLDAEMIRDQILASSGLLSTKMYGPSVKPPQPDGLWKAVTMIGERFKPDSGDSIYRRSVYTYWKRGMPPPQMTILNAPNRDACIARRERTNTPSQALLLLNESEYLKAARHLATQVISQKPQDRLDYMWESVTSHLPDAQERAVVENLLSDLIKKYQSSPKLAEVLCQGVDTTNKTELAAWTMVGNVLYNLDMVKTKD